MCKENVSIDQKVIAVTFWIYVSNGGDGSVYTHTFSSRAAAEKYAENDDERFDEDIREVTVNVDENGKLLDPDPVNENDEDEDEGCED